MKLFKKNQNKGYLSFELLIALGIFAISFVAFGISMNQSFVVEKVKWERTKALLLAREGMEAAYAIRDGDTGELTVGTHGILLQNNEWVFDGNVDVVDQFERSVEVFSSATATREVVVLIAWPAGSSNQQSLSLSQFFGSWK